MFEQERRLVVAGAGKIGEWEELLSGCGVSFGGIEDVLELDRVARHCQCIKCH